MIKVHKAADGVLKHEVEAGRHRLAADELPPAGEDLGPSPHDYLDTALAACTALTVTLVARRKQWPLQDARVVVTHVEDDKTYRLERRLELIGALSEEQKQYLLGIANKCPIHRALHKQFEIDTALAQDL